MSARPRGFLHDWRPRAATVELLDQAEAIIDDVAPEVGAITLRQLFYLLVTRFDYEKTERAYKRLCEALNRARRAGWIAMNQSRDDGSTVLQRQSWQSGDEFLDAVRGNARALRFDRQRDQDRHVVLWCEAAGMAPQLAAAVEEYGIPVLSSGGFDSLTFKHDQAREIADREVPTLALHVGDRDPSGEHVHMSLSEDLAAFVAVLHGDPAHFELRRIAVTDEQIERLHLPTAPPKRTDRRSFDGAATTQAEAIEPRELRRIVREAVELERDAETHAAVLADEAATQAALLASLADVEIP
ncbi:MAG: hypothetical protein OXH70_07885 [Acidobacteria bacterium]|nr:hypothetical protein [Acidobacteriota bacterium]MCY3931623.1 hypothetical protein [Acidobacteriota bacterium]